MKHPERVEDYLEHIAEAAEHAIAFMQGLDSVQALEADPKTQAAVIRCIEIIGEAVTRIQKEDPQFIADHAELPWIEMRGMRNRLIHNYFDVNLGVLWNTVSMTCRR